MATYWLYRLPILVANGILTAFIALLLWRITKKYWLAITAATLIFISPILLGISQIINPDSFLWVFSFISVLSFVLFLKKSSWWITIIDGLFAAIFLGLAILSKYVALIFFPFFLVMLLWYILDDYDELMEQNGLRRRIIVVTLGYPLVIIGAIGLFALLMPAAIADKQILFTSILQFKGMWNILMVCSLVDVFLLLDGVLLKSYVTKFIVSKLQFLKIVLPKFLYFTIVLLFSLAIVSWASGENFLHNPLFENARDYARILPTLPFYMQLISQSKSLLFSLTPVALFLMFFTWVKSAYRKSEYDYLIFILSIFMIIYYYAVTKQGLLVSPRYSIVLYPFAATLGGIGLYELVKRIKHRYAFLLYLLVIVASVMSVWLVRPFYFAYANDLLPKNATISDTWGYGGYEAVQYISSQGDAKNMKIYTNYYGVCQFFAGKCVSEGQVKWIKKTDIVNMDYVVTITDGMHKNQTPLERISDVIPLDKPVWELNIDGRPGNFIKVYKNTNKQK